MPPDGRRLFLIRGIGVFKPYAVLRILPVSCLVLLCVLFTLVGGNAAAAQESANGTVSSAPEISGTSPAPSLAVSVVLPESVPALAAGEAGFFIIDDSGQPIMLEHPAQRIVLLYGGFEELLFGLGENGRIVGRTDASTNPGLLKVASIGTHMRPNFELILSLRPDLVLQMQSTRGESQQNTQRLRELGLNVAVFRLESFADIFSVLERLAVLLDAWEEVADAAGSRVALSSGETANDGSDAVRHLGEMSGQTVVQKPRGNRGAVLAASMRARLASLDDQLSQIARAGRPSVFFELRYPNLLGAGAGSLPNEIIVRAGGRNVLEGSAQRLVKLDEEELLRLDPDVYVMQQGPMYKKAVPLEQRPVLKALGRARALVVEGTEYLYPGLHSVDAVFELARFLHPDLILHDFIIE